ncbi:MULTISPECIES: hypothetical protein [unclassified Desulfovibrio]|jgi:hypothetical protein|uniref:Uncharacterized protein n=1 Tax=uncultured Desulfovibrio sp. TaxID=167968 RepID=A0A212LBX1_9BACT|nr:MULTISPECIES: hypothetical protein [unclassified Desulfovibrio]OXS29458.1 MAG: hypothetical protein BCS36_06895 [Desulfovibrio sp. MES5]SCM74901.1 hypothetical protein KL86DES1_22226 [uncultured Desulfovibrio sp.]SCM75035.1 hypothetical protein KL86DES1_22306 [uncultured Desulfovibrio sp.]VZH35120.1 conserved protein of unknown function [Desulfovibrio sp. 86]VZH35200.1 conserved protein of unknown function [Desulfovibrio sp. 86]
MTELERTLKNTLLTLEQELNATQKMHGTSLVNHQRSLESHAQTIRQLQENVASSESNNRNQCGTCNALAIYMRT